MSHEQGGSQAKPLSIANCHDGQGTWKVGQMYVWQETWNGTAVNFYAEALDSSRLDNHVQIEIPTFPSDYRFVGLVDYFPFSCRVAQMISPSTRNEVWGYDNIVNFPWGSGTVNDNYVSGACTLDTTGHSGTLVMEGNRFENGKVTFTGSNDITFLASRVTNDHVVTVDVSTGPINIQNVQFMLAGSSNLTAFAVGDPNGPTQLYNTLLIGQLMFTNNGWSLSNSEIVNGYITSLTQSYVDGIKANYVNPIP